MNATIDFVDPHTGDTKTYKRYSARLPEFNAKFGPGTGYRVESAIQALTEFQPRRMAAITEAVRAGQKPDDFGLGKLGGLMVCTHRLIDSEGRVVCDARAAAAVQQYKDLEVLETASHQRLMARVGFGGDIFDDDEDRDIQAVADARDAAPAKAETAQAEGRAQSRSEPKAKPAKRARPVRPAKPRKRGKPAAAAETAHEASQTTPEAAAGPANGPAEAASRPDGSEADRPAPAAMIRQLEQLANRVGEDPPEVASFAEAKAQLKRLSVKANGAAAP